MSVTDGAWVRVRRHSLQITKLSKDKFSRQQLRNLPPKFNKTPMKKMSLRELREMLLLADDRKIISDKEFLVLWESYRSKNPEFPYTVCMQDFIFKTSMKPNV